MIGLADGAPGAALASWPVPPKPSPGRRGKAVAATDVYLPHHADARTIAHAGERLGLPAEKVVVDVDRFGNAPSGATPPSPGDADAQRLLQPGRLVLMTATGAGPTSGSALSERTRPRNGASA